MANEKRLIDADRRTIATALKMIHDVDFTPGVYEHSIYGKAALLLEKDAVEVADMREFAEDVACQFGYYCQNNGRLHITHGGLSTLEWAFDILGWENPHPVPEFECEVTGCHEHATCGTQTADGYKRMCGTHFRKHCAKMDGDGNGSTKD